jgi:hypothetical protein
MKTMNALALTLAITASAAFANDHMTQIAAEARELASDYKKMTITLQDKNFPERELQEELKVAEIELEKIQGHMGQFSEAAPILNAAQVKDWKTAQDLVQLLDIFHGRKSVLLEGGDPHTNRAKLLAEAQALLTRANMLADVAKRLSAIPTS